MHEARGKKQVLGTGAIVLALCVVGLLLPTEWIDRIGELFGTDRPSTTAFSPRVVEADEALENGGTADPEVEALVLARRLTRAGPMTSEQIERAAEIWRASAEEPDVVAKLAAEFPRLDPAKIAQEIARFRIQTTPPGTSTATCDSCHRETVELPAQARFDVAGIYPGGTQAREFDDGRRVPWLTEAIELEVTAGRGQQQSCTDCHAPHGEPGFEVDRAERIKNMGLWVTTELSDPSVLHVRVTVKNNASGHLAPAGPGSPGYVVVVKPRQRRQPLELRFGSRLPGHLRSRGIAGEVFARDFRDAAGQPTSERSQIATLLRDTRLESGRFAQLDFVFDRIDDSTAHLDVTLWHLPDVTTWKGAKAIRRADKPER